MKQGQIVPMEITIQLLEEAMRKNDAKDGFLIDGFPRQLDQAFEFEKSIHGCKMVLYYECPEATLLERLVERGKTSGRADDNLETIRKRFQTFIDVSYPVIEHYAKLGKCRKIISDKSVEEVYQDTKRVLDGKVLPHPNIVFVLGGPGSGKGTQCAKLAQEFHLAHLSTGDLLRAQVEKKTKIGLEAAELMKEGKMVPMSVMLEILKAEIDLLQLAPGILIDGFPRAMDQALEFEQTIGPCKKVLAFKCSFQVLQDRLLERGKTSGRADDNLETIKKRFDTYENQSIPVIDYYKSCGKCIEISSEQPVGDVYAIARTVFEPTATNPVNEDSIPKEDQSLNPSPVVEAEASLNSVQEKDDGMKLDDSLNSQPADNAAELQKEAIEVNESETKEITGTEVVAESNIAAEIAGKLLFEGSTIVFVLGGPGSGKGTQCEQIVKEFGYAHLSTGDLLRAEVKKATPLGIQLEADMKEGKMVPLEITLGLLKSAMMENRSAPGFLIDGFPRTMEQAELFELTVGRCTFVLYFEASNEVLTERLTKRGETSGRADDNSESIKKRLVQFEETSMPVIRYFQDSGRVRKVNSEREVSAVTVDTLALFKGI